MSPQAWAAMLLGISCLGLFIHPYVTYPLSLRLLGDRPFSTGDAGTGGSYALLFCAFNEESSLDLKMQNLRLLKAGCPKLEILVYDDCSTDGTASILDANSDLLEVETGKRRLGKAHGMKILAQRAAADFLVFTDANVILDMQIFEELGKIYAANQDILGVAGALKYQSTSSSATASAGGAYWRLEEKIKSLESRTGNVMGADGSIFSARRAIYPDFPDTVQDDFAVSMSCIFRRGRLVYSPAVVAYENLVAESADEVGRKVRIASRAWGTHRYMRPHLRRLSILDRYKYFSHKFLRWFGGSLLLSGIFLTALASALGGVFFVFIGTAAFLFTVGLLAILLRIPIALTLREVLLAVLATQAGIFKALRRDGPATWTPPLSR